MPTRAAQVAIELVEGGLGLRLACALEDGATPDEMTEILKEMLPSASHDEIIEGLLLAMEIAALDHSARDLDRRRD